MFMREPKEARLMRLNTTNDDVIDVFYTIPFN
jgi:hypothetical protein